MRIEPGSKGTPVGPASPAQPGIPAAPPAPATSDEVNLSVLSQAAAGLAPARMEQVEAEVSAGNYRPDAEEVSHSIVDFYLIPIE